MNPNDRVTEGYRHCRRLLTPRAGIVALLSAGLALLPAISRAETSLENTTAPVAAAEASQPVPTVHALSLYGDPALPADFDHLPYANPEAPKGGTLRQAANGSYDSTNPFIIQGTPAAGVSQIYDTLMEESADEPFTMYGLLAGGIRLDPARHWMEVDIRPEARFHDGTPVTAEDVVFSFRLLRDKGQPFYRSYYAAVESITALDEHTVRFEFPDNDSRELPLILGQLPVLPEHYWKERDFTSPTLDKLLGSGPYEIAEVDPGRRIVYQRVDDYWGRDLPLNRGRYNVDRLVYDYFRDQSVALEAFLAGALDLRLESSAKNWATAYDTPAVKDGAIQQLTVPDGQPAGMQGYVFNTRRDKLSDPRVRHAIGLAFDFDWLNRHLFYGAYQRTESFFENSEMKATGLPSDEELALLTPYRDRLPKAVFDQPLPMKTSDELRPRLKKALGLLREAGYEVRDGKLVNRESGQPLTLEFLLYDTQFERVAQPFVRNLARLGIQSKVRLVDVNQYVNRLRSFDFDIVGATLPQSNNPGNEQRSFWTSAYADVPQSYNLAGIKDPVVDQLVDQLIGASSRDKLDTATRALDRVLRWGFYVVPQWYLSGNRVAMWDKFRYPQPFPRYSPAADFSVWWVDADRANTITARQRGQD